ncbi:hypothetical protein COB57_04455 [Candidatus Peregrinibacteria bacterium]|nr:MAG: hypothetical protein COB57_04455 [Candidatus Peregrinibacteria bacterium]
MDKRYLSLEDRCKRDEESDKQEGLLLKSFKNIKSTTGELVAERIERHNTEIDLLRSIQGDFIKDSPERLGIERVLDYLEGFESGDDSKRDKAIGLTPGDTDEERMDLEINFSIEKEEIMKMARSLSVHMKIPTIEEAVVEITEIYDKEIVLIQSVQSLFIKDSSEGKKIERILDYLKVFQAGNLSKTDEIIGILSTHTEDEIMGLEINFSIEKEGIMALVKYLHIKMQKLTKKQDDIPLSVEDCLINNDYEQMNVLRGFHDMVDANIVKGLNADDHRFLEEGLEYYKWREENNRHKQQAVIGVFEGMDSRERTQLYKIFSRKMYTLVSQVKDLIDDVLKESLDIKNKDNILI